MTASALQPNTTPSLTVVSTPPTHVFSMKALSSPADIPSEAWARLRAEFVHLNLQKGDIPNNRGNVVVGRIPPVSEWHPNFVAVLRQFEGRAV